MKPDYSCTCTGVHACRGIFIGEKCYARWPLETPPTKDQMDVLWILWDTQDDPTKPPLDEDTVRREMRLYDA
jgi:hypothetical protein